MLTHFYQRVRRRTHRRHVWCGHARMQDCGKSQFKFHFICRVVFVRWGGRPKRLRSQNKEIQWFVFTLYSAESLCGLCVSHSYQCHDSWYHNVGMQGGLSRVKIAVGIVFVATTALYFTNALSSTPTNSEKAETETCNDEADSNPCGDLSNWLSRAGPVPGYHVRPVHLSHLPSTTGLPNQTTRLQCVMHDNAGLLRFRCRTRFDSAYTRAGHQRNNSQPKAPEGRMHVANKGSMHVVNYHRKQ